jgi:hypothetical protein
MSENSSLKRMIEKNRRIKKMDTQALDFFGFAAKT